MVKRLPTMWKTPVRSLGREDPLEKEMATHCSIHAWKIPWTEEPGRLQSMGSKRVGHDLATKQQTATIMEKNMKKNIRPSESLCCTAESKYMVRSLGQEEPLEKEMVTYSSILA